MKMLGIAFCALTLGACAAAAGEESGLIGYWKLQGDCNDSSGNGNHGVNHNVDLGSGAGRFNGVDSYIEVPNASSLGMGAGPFTVSAWIQCDGGTAQVVGDILNKYDPDSRKGINFHVSASAPGYSSVSDARNLHFGIDNAVEGAWVDCGRPRADNTLISTLIVYKGDLYTGIADALDPTDACHMYRYAGDRKWEDCGRVGDNLKTVSVMSVCAHQGNLYAGTGSWNYMNLGPSGHPSVYRYEGGVTWRDCGLTTPGKRIMSLASFQGNLYASDDAAFLYRYEGDNRWVSCGKVPEYKALSMMSFQGGLYAGASSMILRYAGGASWDVVARFQPQDICQVHSFAVYGGKLYAGTWERGRIMRRDGDNQWAACGDTGAIDDTVMREGRPSYNNEINDLTVYNGKLYAGVIPKGEVWRYDGGQKTTLVKRLVNNADYSPESHLSWRRIPCMTVFQGKLFCGTSTANGAAYANPTDESGKVFSWEAGKCVSYDDDLGAAWRHVVAVRGENQLKLYVDGKLAAFSSPFDSAQFDVSNDKPLLIGFGAENYFHGGMRDVRLYGRELKEPEIKTLYERENSATLGATPVTIIANPGRFGDVEKAAVGEEQVDFWTDDCADADACTESYAAVELQKFLAAHPGLQGRTISLSPAEELPASGYVFVLGNRRSNPLVGCLDEASKNEQKLTTPESYRIRVVPQGPRTVCVIEGKGRVGTLYGVYDYLERVGYRFFGLGEQGTVRPTEASELIRELDIVENPAFLTRGFYAWEPRGNDEFFSWMARNRMNFWTSAEKNIPLLKKLGMILAIGAHDIQTRYLNPKSEYPYNVAAFAGDPNKPADPYPPSPEYAGDANGDGKLSYFEAHPEWFGLRGGKRSDKIQGSLGDNYCTSNDDATAELAKNFTKGLVDGAWSKADVVNFWMEDGGHWCECDRCKELGIPSDRLLLLVYKVNQEVQNARRDGRLKRNVHLTTLAYLDTIEPPTRPLPADFDTENCSVTFYPIQRCYAHAMDDPKCDEINKRYLAAYLGWTPHEGGYYRGAMFIGEYYNVSNYKSMPVVYTRVMAADIPWYYRSGARHMQYMHTLTKGWGTWTLNQRLLAQMLWNPTLDVHALLNDYFCKYYPGTTERARAFYGHLEDAFRNITQLKSFLPFRLNGNAELFPIDHFHYEPRHPVAEDGPSLLETIDSLRLAGREIDDALLECKDPVERARLVEDEQRFAYGEDMVDFYYHMARTAMFEKSQEDALARREFEKVEQAAVKLQRYGRSLVETFTCPDDGLGATHSIPRYQAMKKKYGNDASDKPPQESIPK